MTMLRNLRLKTAQPEIRVAETTVTLPDYFPDKLCEAASVVIAASGTRLFEPGAPAMACYRVIKGCVVLSRRSGDGSQITLQHAMAGDWLIEPIPYDSNITCTALADRKTTLHAVPIGAFRSALLNDAAFAYAWSRETAQTAKRLQSAVERLCLCRASDRIVHYLTTEADAKTGELHLSFPLCEWARRLGMAGETMSRVLAEMSAEGIVIRSGRRAFRLPSDSCHPR